MKISILNNVQHRELHRDFIKEYHSNWVDAPWYEVASAEQYRRYYWASIEEHVHAAKLGLEHPESGERMEWESPLPRDLADVLRRLRETTR